jgi:5-amino-6-(5-phosphoribosylamino)uracil reductase
MRPLVTLSYAQTLDGYCAARDGSSQWISSAESLRMTHQLRAEHAAVMVGSGTVLADDPRLTVRLVPTERQPLRVICDGRLRTPPTAAVLRDGAATGSRLFHRIDAAPARVAALLAAGAQLTACPSTADGSLDLAAVLAQLAADGISSVMVEGGPQLAAALLRARLVDRLVVTVAPILLGAGHAAVAELGITRLADGLQLDDVVWQRYGRDSVLSGRIRPPSTGTPT